MKLNIQGLLKNRSVISTGSSILFASLMMANVIAYLYHILMAKMMAPADYGIMVTLTSISYLLDVIMRTVQASVTKTIASMGEDNYRNVSNILIVSLRILLPLACVIFILIWISSGYISKYLNLGTAIPVILLGFFACLQFLEPIPRGILLGLDHTNKASVTVIIEPIARLAIGTLLVLWGWKAVGAISGYLAGAVLASIVGMMFILPFIKTKTDQEQYATNLKGIDRYSILVFIINMCLMIMASVDQIIIKHYFSSVIAGNYAVTFVLGRVILMSAISLGIVIFTRSATMLIEDPKRASVLAKSLLVMATIALTTTVVTMAFPRITIQLIAGSQYQIAHSYIGLVGIEMALFGLVYVQTYYHISIGKMNIVWPLLIATVLEIALLSIFHESVQQVLIILIIVVGSLLAFISALTWSVLHENVNRQPVMDTGTY